MIRGMFRLGAGPCRVPNARSSSKGSPLCKQGPRPRSKQGNYHITTSHRRIALLTGASLSALGIATPAFAAPHDLAADGTYAGTSVVDTTAPYTDTITICAIATASPECFLGVKNSGAATETSTVNSVPTGQILVHAPTATDASLSVVNAAGSSA